MTAMEEDALKTDQGTAGKVPEPAQAPAPVASSAPVEKLASPDSPFLGKLVPEKPTIPLNRPTLETDAELQRTIDVINARSKTVPPQASASIEVPKAGQLKPEDLLHGGNVISLLQEEAQKESGVEKLTETRLAKEDTPIERNIREIGLQPRKVGSAEPSVPRPLEHSEALPNIRTYASDMSEEIRKRGETLSTIVNAEKIRTGGKDEAVPETEKRQERIKNLTLIAGAGLLVLIGISAVIGVFIFMQQHPPELPKTGMIPTNRTESLDAQSNPSLQTALAELRDSASLNLGEIEEISVTGGAALLSAETILTRLGAPSILARNATDIMVGVHSYNHNQPFILVRVSAYDRAFDGMLSWEPKMGESLGAFFAPAHGAAPKLRFSDGVFQNLDVRESQPEWRILYAFPEKNLLLITTNESTLREVTTRLTLQSGN